MNIVSETRDGVLFLRPEGRIDTRTAGEFEKAAMGAMDESTQPAKVLVDFGALDYINSTGMRVLLILAKRLSATSGKLVLCGMKEHIVEVFSISGFNQILTITDTEEEALTRF